MLNNVSLPILAVMVLFGISIDQFGTSFRVIAVISLLIMAICIVFIWIRVGDLSQETSKLTENVGTLNTKIGTLEETMKPSTVDPK